MSGRRTAVISTWGDISHLLIALDLADALALDGWTLRVIGLEAVRAQVEARGHVLHTLPPLPPGVGWTLLAHLQRCNRIDHRADRPGPRSESVLRSGRRTADLTLELAVRTRVDLVARLLEEVRADLVIWDPTELTAPTAAHRLGVPHLGLNFLAEPTLDAGDWWCDLMVRWRSMVRALRVDGPVHLALGDLVDFLPPWCSSRDDAWAGLDITTLDLRPTESVFGPDVPGLSSEDALIVLSTAYRTETPIVRSIVDGVHRAGLRAVVLAARTVGAPVLGEADVVIDRAPATALAREAGVVVTAAGSHSMVSLAAGRTPAVAVPVRVHSYWEVVGGPTAGIGVCPADELTPDALATLIGAARPPSPPTGAPALRLEDVVERLSTAFDRRRG